MAHLPTGTVTFLLTDIEGSTAHWERHPEAMRRALARHDHLIAAGVRERGGVVVKSRGEGDSIFAVFSRASDAIAAACDVQRALQAEAWPTAAALRVRMALHTGEAEVREGDYYGSAVNRCARLRGVGHGGQILLSEATAALVRGGLPEGAGLRDLGAHRLRDLQAPERVSQLILPGLPADFPALRTLEGRPNNLPVQPNPLVGRERELDAARGLLLGEAVRLLTLTGPGGTGKTRLGLQLAAALLDHFGDGAYFVPLAPIRDPALVASAVAQALGVREIGGRPILDSLKDYLRDKRLLLVLDNFEQILPAAPLVADVLGACPRLKVLVTSRAVLDLRGEKEFAVPPLALPEPGRLPPAEALAEYAAVALFAQRAGNVRAEFDITDENAAAVAEICRRLDGLPLAIELAAARIRLLAPEAILARLERRLPLLTGGARDLPERQRTLRGTIAWSYDLLDEGERALFRRLSIFVGGCTLEAAEAVGDPDGELGLDVLDGVTSLVAKSLLRQEDGPDGEPRFGMLETIREFGLERLAASGEAEATRVRHAEYFLALAEAAEPELLGADQGRWFDRLERDLDNIRAALDRGPATPGEVEVSLRLAGALWRFWDGRGHIGEGRRWLAELLGCQPAATSTPGRAKALFAAGWLAALQEGVGAAGALAAASVALWRRLGDPRGLGWSLFLAALVRRAAAKGRRRPDQAAAGLPLAEEALALARRLDDRALASWSIWAVAELTAAQGDLARAIPLFEEARSLAEARRDRAGASFVLRSLAQVAGARGEYARAATYLKERLLLAKGLEDQWNLADALEGLAWVASMEGQAARAARLYGAGEALREASGTAPLGERRLRRERRLAALREVLGEAVFEAEWAAGRGMPLEQAIAYALEEPVPA